MFIMIKQEKNRGVEQQVARRAHNPEVAGSNPAPATNVNSGVFERRLLFYLICFSVLTSVTTSFRSMLLIPFRIESHSELVSEFYLQNNKEKISNQ
jgi:hypothetical protein